MGTVADREPKPPFPKQHLEKPGLESDLDPKPRYQARAYKPAGKLDGRCALVTGGDSGIGRAVAVMFAREGADVAIVYLPVEQSDAEETGRAIEKAGRRALLIPGDVSNAAFCRVAIGDVVSRGVRRAHADEAARAARGGCAGLRVLCLGRRLQLHHRRGADAAGR